MKRENKLIFSFCFLIMLLIINAVSGSENYNQDNEFCNDPDGPMNYLESSYCEDANGIYYDSCEGNYVTEWQCRYYECFKAELTCFDIYGENYICEDGKCIEKVCVPNCEDKECGDDGCGGSCGECDSNEKCVDGTCEKIKNDFNWRWRIYYRLRFLRFLRRGHGFP